MTYRVKLLADLHMHLDGQPGIVLSGTVMDVPDTMNFTPGHIQRLSPGETAGAVRDSKPTSVRGVRRK